MLAIKEDGKIISVGSYSEVTREDLMKRIVDLQAELNKAHDDLKYFDSFSAIKTDDPTPAPEPLPTPAPAESAEIPTIDNVNVEPLVITEQPINPIVIPEDSLIEEPPATIIE